MKIFLEGKHLKLDTVHFEEIREHFSVKNDNVSRSEFATDRQYVITPTGRAEIGMYFSICDYFLKKFPTESIQVGTRVKEVSNPHLDIGKISSIDGFEYRDYQDASITAMCKIGRGIIVIPTAGGKSLIMGGFSKTLIDHNTSSKVLVIVPNLTLLTQTHKDFIGYGLDATKWSGTDEPDLSKSVLLVNSQILLSNIKASLKIVSDYDYLLVDECHKVKRNNKINKIIFNLKTPNKFGFTGTLPENQLDEWNVIGKLGSVLYTKTSKELRDTKSISNVKVKVLQLQHNGVPKKDYLSKLPTANYNLEGEFLYNSKWRNSVIKDIANKLSGNCLILVDRIDHGLLLESMLSCGHKETVFIRGATQKDDREEIRSIMEVKNNVACVAMSSIFSTGISINNLPYVIFVCIGKAKTKVLQSIGRSLRLHDNKKVSIIFDIADTTKYSDSHLNKRLEMYDLEEIPYEIKTIRE